MSDTSTVNNPSQVEFEHKLLTQLKNPWKLRLFFLTKLPSCLWWGVSLKSIDARVAQVQLPYSWRTQNPFKSIYFAAQIGAGEFATGLLCKLAMEGKGSISMLAINASAEFTKKANSLVTFTCNQGEEVSATVEKAIATQTPQTIIMTAEGVQANGEIVSRVNITWSFKVK